MILDYISFQEEVFLFLLCGKINNSALHVSAEYAIVQTIKRIRAGAAIFRKA